MTVNLPLISILRQTWSELGDDRIGLISAGIAFYGLLSLFPGIAALLALGGLMTEPQTLVDSFQTIGRLLPDSAADIILSQATEVAGSRDGGLGLAALFTLFLTPVIYLGLARFASSRAQEADRLERELGEANV